MYHDEDYYDEDYNYDYEDDYYKQDYTKIIADALDKIIDAVIGGAWRDEYGYYDDDDNPDPDIDSIMTSLGRD
jgi:hypothetical protein